MVHVWLIRLFRRARTRKSVGLTAVAGLLLLAVLGNTVCFYLFERGENPELTIGDSLWYSLISVTTIGYGDYSATTTPARVATAIFIIGLGLSAFSLFFGLVIDWFTEMALKGDRGMGKVSSRGHTIIVHFPSAARVEQLVRELQSEAGGSVSEVVIVSDQIETLPFRYPDVTFIRGSALLTETYQRANIASAAKVVILATSYDDPNSDAVVASAASVIAHLSDDVHIVAECLHDEHRQLFQAVRTDAIVSALRITGNLLVQESQDPGISQMFNVITSNLEGDTLYSVAVGSPRPDSYGELAKRLLDNEVNLLTVLRGEQTYATFTGLTPAEGDRVIYLAARRKSWSDLAEMCGLGAGG